MMFPVGKPLVLLSVVVCLAAAVAGCGSSSDSTSTAVTAGGGGDNGAGSLAGGGGGDRASSDNAGGSQSSSSAGSRAGGSSSGTESGPGGSGGGGPNGGSRGVGASSGGPKTNDNGTPLGTDTDKNGDNSIQTYGTDAQEAERDAVIAAMRSYVTAIATRDYAAVCAGLSDKLRAGLRRGSEGCQELVRSLLIIPPAQAYDSASGTVTEVRVGGGNAFVLFRPASGGQLNYFAMTLEDGEWKALGLTIGEPLDPAAEIPG